MNLASRPQISIIHGTLAMTVVVTVSNILVQYPFGDLLTYGAFTYPVAFFVTDLMNRLHGPAAARKVAIAGFALAVLLSIVMATPRIAMASGTAFLVAQLLDIAIFDKLRDALWWRAPLLSSVIGGAIDTILFFSLAFAAPLAVLGANDAYAIGHAAVLGPLLGEIPRWAGWAIGDYGVKLAIALLMLTPYALITRRLATV